jgi:hypothetical protein
VAISSHVISHLVLCCQVSGLYYTLQISQSLAKGQKSENMAFQEKLYSEYTLFRNRVPSPAIAAARRYCRLWLQTNACIAAEIQSAFSSLWVHSEFEYCSFILSYNGNELLFGTWWNWKAVEMQDMYVTWDCGFSGASRSITQRRDSVTWREGWSLYIRGADNNEKCVY